MSNTMSIENVLSYEALSEEIKESIEVYHNGKVKNGFAKDMQSTTKEWFERHFEEWITQKKLQFGDNDYRQNIRINVELPVAVADTLIDTQEKNSDIDVIGSVTNISRGGLFFTSDKRFNPSSILRIRLDFGVVDSIFDNIEALSMVLRCDDLGDGAYGVGLVFSSLYYDHKETLNLFIFKHLIDYITNSDEAIQ